MFIICSQNKAKEKGGAHPRLLPHHFYMGVTFRTLLSEQDISLKKYITFSELVILAVDRTTTVT